MLAISPMPVDGIRDREALEESHSERMALPALPTEVIEPDLAVTMASQAVASIAGERSEELPRLACECSDTLDATFMVDAISGSRILELPPRRPSGTRPIAKAHAEKPIARGSNLRNKIEKPSAEPRQSGPKKIGFFRRFSLPALLLLLVVLFFVSIVYVYNRYAGVVASRADSGLIHGQEHPREKYPDVEY